jgi:hypothetical protein
VNPFCPERNVRNDIRNLLFRGASGDPRSCSYFAPATKQQAASIFKGYASEVIQAIKCVYCFTLARNLASTMPGVARVVTIMDTVLDIFKRGEAAVEHAAALETLFMELHCLTLELFSADHAKVKLHHCHHLGPQLVRMQTSASCFSNERRNQLLKKACSRLHHLADNHKQATARWLAECIDFFAGGHVPKIRAVGKCMDAPECSELMRKFFAEAHAFTELRLRGMFLQSVLLYPDVFLSPFAQDWHKPDAFS